MKRQKSLDVMMLIVPPKHSEKIVPMLESMGAHFSHIVYGNGTEKSEVLNLLGLGDPQREILLTAVDSSKVKDIYARLEKKFNFGHAGNGVACTMPVASVGGALAMSLLEGFN